MDSAQLIDVIRRGITSLAKSGSAKLTGDVTLSEGTNITLTQSGQNIEIAAAAGGGDPAYAPGSFTLATGKFRVQVLRMTLTGSQRETLQGTARVRGLS